MIEEIDMGEMKLPNLLILPCFWGRASENLCI